jgi:hypothetical protein
MAVTSLLEEDLRFSPSFDATQIGIMPGEGQLAWEDQGEAPCPVDEVGKC